MKNFTELLEKKEFNNKQIIDKIIKNMIQTEKDFDSLFSTINKKDDEKLYNNLADIETQFLKCKRSFKNLF